MFNIVLVEPEIPQNTGTIGRLCLATDSILHLVGPLGFSLDAKAVKRAGLDYWDQVKVQTWPDWAAFVSAAPEKAAFHFLTTRTERRYWDARFERGDYLVFGSETRGLPQSLLDANAESTLTIPQESVRSLNLATAAGIVLYEGMRQLDH